MRLFSFLLLIAFLYSACTSSSAEVKLENGDDVRRALSNEWETAYMETTGSRGKVPEGQITNTVFNKNGTFSSRLKDGAIVTKGNWEYDPATKLLYMGIGKEKGSGRVLKLTGGELIIAEHEVMNEEIVDSVVVTYKRL